MLCIQRFFYLLILSQICAQNEATISSTELFSYTTTPNTKTEQTVQTINANSEIGIKKSSDQVAETKNEYEFTNKIAINYIWPTIPIGFLVLGTISNILSILVFLRREMIKFSSFWYFAVLNAINLAVLYVTLGRVIMNYNFKTDLRESSLFACKLHVFLTYFLGHLSSLLLCMISIDRVVSVMFLHKAKTFCTPKVALICTTILIVFNFLLSSHIFIFESGYYKPINNSDGSIDYVVHCQARNGTIYDTFLQHTWKLIDMSIFAFIPFIIMLTCSVIIIIRVAQQSKKFEKRSNTQNNRRESRKESKDNDYEEHQANKPNKNKTEAKFSTRTRNLAIMLIPVNVLFLIFLSPVVITIYVYNDLSKDELTLAVVELLSYCNFTFNFIIYFLTSSKFREEFYRLINEDLLAKLGVNRSLNLAPRGSFKNNTNVAKSNNQKNKANNKTIDAKYMKIDQNVQIN